MVGIVFWDAQGIENSYDGSKQDLSSKTFVAVQVNGGIWILYQDTNYNNLNQGQRKFMKLEPGPKQDLSNFSPKFIWRATATSNAVDLFEFKSYGGLQRNTYSKATPDITKDFPNGVSSMIIWPVKAWNLYESPHYQGGCKKALAGDYPTGDFPHKKLGSLKPVQ